MDLEAHEISHRFAELEVLAGLSFRVSSGSVVAVVGPSGCGKSTLLRILGGLIAPSCGRVTMLGEPASSCLNPVTFVFQDFALLPLFILWFGIGEASKVATIAFGVFFPSVVSTYAAVDAVPRSLVRTGQSFELGSAAIVRKILIPGALPGILAELVSLLRSPSSWWSPPR